MLQRNANCATVCPLNTLPRNSTPFACFMRPSFKAQWLLYVPPGLTFDNPTFCPYSVFMCFVWISERTAIISLYSINWLVFITETECVYCAVRPATSYIYIVGWIPFSEFKNSLNFSMYSLLSVQLGATPPVALQQCLSCCKHVYQLCKASSSETQRRQELHSCMNGSKQSFPCGT
jgi:hypothetical protein